MTTQYELATDVCERRQAAYIDKLKRRISKMEAALDLVVNNPDMHSKAWHDCGYQSVCEKARAKK